MADDRPADLPPRPVLEEVQAEWEEGPDFTPEEDDAWLAANFDWVKAKVDEALNDPRPAIPIDEAFARVRARLAAKYGSPDEGA